MTIEKKSAKSEMCPVVSGELGARGYFEDFCVNESGLWTHPVDPQIQVFLNKGTIAFTTLSPKKNGEAYQVLCDFDAQKVHFLSANIILPTFGRGIILAAPSVVGYSRHTEDLQNLIDVVPRFCGMPKRQKKHPKRASLFSLLMGSGAGS